LILGGSESFYRPKSPSELEDKHGLNIVDTCSFAQKKIFFSVSTSFGKMSHQLKFEAVVQNLDRVIKTLRLILTAFAAPSMAEVVTQWLPLCPHQRAFFLYLFFV
jgi:hypothetical protein